MINQNFRISESTAKDLDKLKAKLGISTRSQILRFAVMQYLFMHGITKSIQNPFIKS